MRMFAERFKQPLGNMMTADPGQEMETKVVWPSYFKVFHFAKTILQGTVTVKMKKR